MASPDRIGRYRVDRLLGSGAFASVWLGVDETIGERVAIKVLAENWAHVSDVRDRFLQEATLLRRADSDRVVRMFDIGELPDGRPYFVMSYADGGTLADRLTGSLLPLPEALHIAIETALAVAVLHRLEVVHRDIKPSNVLVQTVPDGGERILVGDLGVAKSTAQASGFTVAVGTPGYMAPEQRDVGIGIDVRADVYGLGALAYHLTTGDTYDNSKDAARRMRQVDLPRKLQSILTRALQRDRERRWPDAKALADALIELMAEIDQPAVNTPPADSARDTDETSTIDIECAGLAQPKPARRRSRRLTRLASVGLVIAVAGAIILVVNLDRDEGGHEAIENPTSSESARPMVSSSAPASPTNSAPATSPEPPSLGPLEINFSIDAVPGYRVAGTAIAGSVQWAEIKDTNGVHTSLGVYSPGTFDPSEAQDGERITVRGKPGFYDDALPDPETGDTVAEQTRKPAAVVQYAPDAWFVIQSDLKLPEARAAVGRIAEAVNIGTRRQLRFPVRFDYLPAALHACGGLDGLDLGWDGPWNAWIDLCDDKPASDATPGTEAVKVMMTLPDGVNSPPAAGSRRINGLPVEDGLKGATVGCGGFILSITVADSHWHQRYDLADIEKIIQGMAVRSFNNKSTWFPGNVAVPNT